MFYLSDILINNIGPIEKLDIDINVKEGNKKPTIFVGKNGTGKTILISHIVDSLFELACVFYYDIIEDQGKTYRSYFKSVGGLTPRSDSKYSICILKYIEGDEKYFYVDKTGLLKADEFLKPYSDRFEGIKHWSPEINTKFVVAKSDNIERIFKESSICFFPTGRFEIPHWLNPSSINIQNQPHSKKTVRFLNKPIYINSSIEENEVWITDVISDSLLDYDVKNEKEIDIDNKVLPEKILLKKSVNNIEYLLNSILEEKDLKLRIGKRSRTERLYIEKDGKQFIPSLKNLSAGQAILFNMFCTLIRYSDVNNLNSSIDFNKISGIVVIDEIESNLHSSLQYSVLPNLIKLFPNVQFFITSHSPLFLLGMKNVFKEENLLIFEMPEGKRINTDRFQEFKKSFDFYRNTEAFEAELSGVIMQAEKIVLFTEGETDRAYLNTAIKLLGRKNLTENLMIKSIGRITKSGEESMGSKNLDNAKRFLRCHSGVLKSKVILLYDHDTKKKDEDFENFFMRVIPVNKDNKRIKKGIENLLPEKLFDNSDARIYPKKETTDGYGATKIIQVLDKTQLCELVCNERKNKDDFKKFEPLLDKLESTILH